MKLKKVIKVNKAPCLTCPFAGERPVRLCARRKTEIYAYVLRFRGSHTCHTTNDKTLCRGGRDLQLNLLASMGVITAPTDEAFDAASRAAMGDRP